MRQSRNPSALTNICLFFMCLLRSMYFGFFRCTDPRFGSLHLPEIRRATNDASCEAFRPFLTLTFSAVGF